MSKNEVQRKQKNSYNFSSFLFEAIRQLNIVIAIYEYNALSTNDQNVDQNHEKCRNIYTSNIF